MTKSELIKRISARLPELTAAEAEATVNLVLDMISDTLAADGRIELRGFGAFSVRTRAARTARNPKTGTKVQVAARKYVYFRPGKEFKALVNG